MHTCLPVPGTQGRETMIALLNDYDKLREKVKARILEMPDEYGQEASELPSHLAGKWLPNAIETENEGSALYDNISFINHSCSTNVHWTIEERKEVRVCRRIEEGEEIVADYCTLDLDFPTREESVDEKLERRKFVCHCDLYSLTGDNLKQDD